MTGELHLPIPSGWIVVERPRPGIAVVMGPPATDTGPDHRPVVAITRAPHPPPSGPPGNHLPAHQTQLVADVVDAFPWPVVEERDVVDLDGHAVSYVRINHQANTLCLISELWTWVLGAEEWTVTGTTPLDQYPIWCDVFEAIAAAFSPDERPEHQVGLRSGRVAAQSPLLRCGPTPRASRGCSTRAR